MTRKGITKVVDGSFGRSRLQIARAFLRSAQDGIALSHAGEPQNPVMSHVVNAAIAY